jgi:predicted nucleic acid-binding protein
MSVLLDGKRPATQGTLLRFLVRVGVDASVAAALLASFTAAAEHEFWPDDFVYDARVLRGVIGHRQVTDAYLAAHARGRGGSIATFDAGLLAAHRDIAVLVPTSR